MFVGIIGKFHELALSAKKTLLLQVFLRYPLSASTIMIIPHVISLFDLATLIRAQSIYASSSYGTPTFHCQFLGTALTSMFPFYSLLPGVTGY
jgi:hypothetical protein